MIIKVFSVYDDKSLLFRSPFYQPAVGAALRAFSEACNDKSIEIGKYPGDFTLFHVADYDDSNGSFVNVEPPANMGRGTEFVRLERSNGSIPSITPVEAPRG